MDNETVEEQEKLTTAKLAKRSEPIQEDGSDKAEGSETRTAMFSDTETEGFRSNWHSIQADFVDSPRESVRKADELVAAVIQRLAEVFSAERERLESNWGEGRDVSTEDFRQVLRHYRSFFDRLLSL
jgi:hypothetical protein